MVMFPRFCETALAVLIKYATTYLLEMITEQECQSGLLLEFTPGQVLESKF